MEDSWQCVVCLHLCDLEREWRTGVAKGGKLRGLLGDGVWWCYWPTLMVLVWAAEFGGCLPSLWYNGSRWRSARRLRSARTQLLHLFPEIMTRLHVYFVVSRFMLTSRLWIDCFLNILYKLWRCVHGSPLPPPLLTRHGKTLPQETLQMRRLRTWHRWKLQRSS